MKLSIGIVALIGLSAVATAQNIRNHNGNAQRRVQIARDGRAEKLLAPRTGLNMADRQVVRDASVANMFEIMTSQVAQNRGSSPFVRQFAKEMIADHTAAQAELKQLVRQKGGTIPASLPARQQAVVSKLRGLSGRRFDDQYRAAQIAGHAETKAKLERYLQVGRDGDVRSYVVKTLPAVTMHLKNAQQRKTMMMGNGR